MTLHADTLDAAISEREFARTVTDALTLYGFLWVHYRPARTKDGWRTPLEGHAGGPDILAVKGEHLWFIETKAERGRLRPEQDVWIKALVGTGLALTVIVLRPSMWPSFLGLLQEASR